jgi:hypothetical protein
MLNYEGLRCLGYEVMRLWGYGVISCKELQFEWFLWIATEQKLTRGFS